MSGAILLASLGKMFPSICLRSAEDIFRFITNPSQSYARKTVVEVAFPFKTFFYVEDAVSHIDTSFRLQQYSLCAS